MLSNNLRQSQISAIKFYFINFVVAIFKQMFLSFVYFLTRLLLIPSWMLYLVMVFYYSEFFLDIHDPLIVS